MPTFSHLSPLARSLWAKSGEPGHGLLAHLLDVAATAQVILEHEPDSTRRWAAEAFGLEPKHVSRWMALLVGLHDFGKGIPGFQSKWEPGMQVSREAGLTYPAAAVEMDRHDLASAALLSDFMEGMPRKERSWWRSVVQAVAAHHGFHFLVSEVQNGRPIGEPSEWATVRLEILTLYRKVLAPGGATTYPRLSLPAVNWLAGLTSTADWIASNPDWFPLGEREESLHDHYTNACHLATKALRTIGWDAYRPLVGLDGSPTTESLLSRMTGRNGIQPRPLQQVGDCLLRQAQGPALFLVEAPMGEGKTELAFLALLRLQASNGHRGLYVATPTQATGNAIFRRALSFLEEFAAGHIDIQLIHGGASMAEDVWRLRDINGSRAESIAVSAWFSQRRRPLLSPYGVGTVDQALLSVLNVKHHFVRLWGLANRVIVLDEVHAYDTYTSGLIAVLLCWLKALGSSVVLMSATLPKSLKIELLLRWGVEVNRIPELAYPRVIIADAAGIRAEHFAAREQAPITLSGLDESLDSLAAQALLLVAEGGCGAVIVNTVDRAQKLYLLLQRHLDSDTELLLFHARFPAEVRRQLEDAVLRRFGLDGIRPGRALLVATQVVEQSLDLDFDFMLSDLAPVDLLLQRAGRLHRHLRQRPEVHASPRLWVAGLIPGRLPELKETGWGHVYDPYILARTWALLHPVSRLDLPADIDRWVQAVYGDTPIPEGVAADVASRIDTVFHGEHLAKVQLRRREFLNIAIDPGSSPSDAYVNKPRGYEEAERGEAAGLLNRTRLGPESITVVPVEVLEDELWRVHGGPEFSPKEPVPDSLARRLYDRQITVSRAALVRHFHNSEPVAAFAEHPLLRNLFPLPLIEGRYEATAGFGLVLDPSLGLVYETTKSA
ncbi:MAG: CRISPR-associated helicase Cas3' [Pigmentiphaga sp.]|uniref:CRISPR-associated helicase Cas3' n=1 Tax=Pigmentiphaga sp. TaxID=1977564 RepID=UPI0029A51A16|nr:CRISPR-associated helicase Cas3' [Pigmentiphaga sp.]MDX3905104.1 CRISPR-associated helicase Cas3' [Pigmentiphaga sp.]